MDFRDVVFTDECRATLNSPGGFCRGWVANGEKPPVRRVLQQGVGGVIICACISQREIISLFRVEKGVNIKRENYFMCFNRADGGL